MSLALTVLVWIVSISLAVVILSGLCYFIFVVWAANKALKLTQPAFNEITYSIDNTYISNQDILNDKVGETMGKL